MEEATEVMATVKTVVIAFAINNAVLPLIAVEKKIFDATALATAGGIYPTLQAFLIAIVGKNTKPFFPGMATFSAVISIIPKASPISP